MEGLDLIRGLAVPPTPAGSSGASKPSTPGGVSFAQRASEAFLQVDQLQKNADREVSKLAAGDGSTVETMVALSKADLSLRLVVALRNRALQAYETLMRMQV